ncbi:MAG: hypothetical protein JO250_10505 [Armatimonadetes bacterium]|nr:hypothetical protein [Armatimonadota bacterium]
MNRPLTAGLLALGLGALAAAPVRADVRPAGPATGVTVHSRHLPGPTVMPGRPRVVASAPSSVTPHRRRGAHHKRRPGHSRRR